MKFKKFAIDSNEGYLFLTKYHTQNRTAGASLSRYSLDGSDEMKLIKEKIFFPHEITLDVAMKQIYFLDHYLDYIQQCDYNGKHRIFLQKLPIMKLNRIAFFENNFFGATNQKNSSIVQTYKFSATFKKIIADGLKANPKMLKIFHQQAQPRKTINSKVCAQNNKCEHLCVPVVDKSSLSLRDKCICKEGFMLENGKCRFKDSKKFVMFVEENPRILKAFENENLENQSISPIVGLKSNVAFDVDLNNKLIYYSSYTDSHM
jgi:low density lipoprotein-related protein 2